MRKISGVDRKGKVTREKKVNGLWDRSKKKFIRRE